MASLSSLFYYPINLHYSQTETFQTSEKVLFYYPINLHYSQTQFLNASDVSKFYYPINLHYSQTTTRASFTTTKFYYPINLHYSQTSNFEIMTLLISENLQDIISIAYFPKKVNKFYIMHKSLSIMTRVSCFNNAVALLSIHISVIPLSKTL